MMRILLLSLFLPSVFAITYQAETLPYTDAPTDRPTAVAVGTLTDLGILGGHPDGTFKPGVSINRAEFMKIAMSLLPLQTNSASSRCFPDVGPESWYAPYVCRAKALGIVRGNALPGIDSDFWPFEPTRSVKYEEALKILSGIYDVPLLTVEGEWYETYVQSAQHHSVHLTDSAIGSALTRGQMARLVIAFMAYNNGELDDLRYAQNHSSMSARTVFSAPASLASTSSVSSASSVSSESSVMYDPYLNDTSTDGAVLLLGKVTQILGGASIFPDTEPLRIEKFVIDLVAANTSLDALNVYDDSGRYLGRATRENSTRFVLRVQNQTIIIPKRVSYSFYVRGVLKAQDQGGSSGGSIQVDEMGVIGIGDWSNRDYQQFTDSSDTFAASTVARSAITSVVNAGDTSAFLVPGDGLEIGAFRMTGVTSHAAATLQVTAINFTLGVTGGVTVTAPYLRVDGSSDIHTCSVAGITVTCASLPASFGDIDNSTRTLRLYGDIAIPQSSQSARLQVTINNPGTISSAGDITWTDGVTSFTWIDLSGPPIARGTSYSY